MPSTNGNSIPHPGQSLGPYLTAFDNRDRRKLTFYFVADRRIDFRELVRELFRFVFPACLLRR